MEKDEEEHWLCRRCCHRQRNKRFRYKWLCNERSYISFHSVSSFLKLLFCRTLNPVAVSAHNRINKAKFSNYVNHTHALMLLLLSLSVSAFPPLCAEPHPIDILANALSESEGLSSGVEVIRDINDVNGYRFDASARLLGVDSGEIFPLCNKFPPEFSIIVTLQQQTRRSTNEFIMTLLDKDRQTVLLAVRMQRGHIFFDYLTNSGKKISVGFKNDDLTDGKWHTFVITVTLKHVKFTLDCKPSYKRKTKSSFPKRMNIKGTRIYVASRRKKRNRFTGLLRQLILLPGSDAAVRICPSNNPALATLYDTGSASTLPTSYPSVIFEENETKVSCSMSNRGSMLYTEDMMLKVCTGSMFKPVRGGSERMDYVIDFEDILTNSYTVSIEKFSIPGEGLFIATANNDDMIKNVSQIFRWDGKKFTVFQEIKTQSAMMWKFFHIGSEYFLAVANSGGEGVENVTSVIYRWSQRKQRFQRHQFISTLKARSIDFLTIDSMHFLVVANQNYPNKGQQPGNPNESSVVYRWNPDFRIFQAFQNIPTEGALDITFFQISINPSSTYSCLVVANAFNGKTSHVKSAIYCWFNSEFVFYQYIETVGAADWEFFQFQDRYFLAVANSFDKTPNTDSIRYLNSSIYELNLQYPGFFLYQNIETNGANDWEFFTIGTQYFLIVSNTVSSTSEIYRWQGVEKFVKVHSLPVGRSSDFDYISINDDHYLASANPNGVLSKLFKIMTY